MTETPTRLELARAGAFDDIPIYALADGSRLKVWDGDQAPDPNLVNLWLDPADEILKRYDVLGGWTDAGIVGATGDVGPEGEKGDKGETGEPGPKGEKGETGSRGPSGARGENGLKGERGPGGVKGDKGAKGERGDTGARGPKGDTGERGEKGEKGARGERGYSVLSGRRNPDPDDGRNGDFWINTVVAYIFGPKTDGEWPNGVPLRGTMGPRGLSGTPGSPGPGVATGGMAGQLLSKIDATDYNTEWVDAPEGTGGGGGVTDHGALTGLEDDDHPQYHNDARGDARYKPLSYVPDFSDLTFDDGRPEYEDEQLALWSDRELPEDSRAETDGVDAYPTGISIMPVTAGANWGNQFSDALITTHRGGIVGRQEIVIDGGGWRAYREWDESEPEWRDWTQYAPLEHSHDVLRLGFLDNWPESTDLTTYTPGFQVMPVSAAEDWGPNTAEAGFVVQIYHSATNTGRQTFIQNSDGLKYERRWTGVAWGSWSSGGGGGLDQATADTLYEPLDSAYTKAESDTRYVNESDHTKAAHDALDIDADTLDGIDSTGFVQTGDYEDSDVLAKVKNVDGTGSGLDADTVDGIQASAFLQSVPDASTTVKGSTKLSTAPASPTSPIAVGDNDTRMTNARTPTTHASTHTNGTDDIQNATAAQKGLATAAQITKLDGIETGATADQTAAEILTAIKTVDGTGTGLDADLLDGNEATAFVGTARTISTTAPLTGGGDLSANRTLAVSSSSETAQGVIEIATQAEMTTGTDDVRAVTPLKARTANDARYLQSVTQATETVVGGGEIATQAEFNTGTDDTRIVTPLKARVGNDARYVRTVNSTAPDGSGNVTVATGGGTTGSATLDFGAFPGATDATLAVTGQAGILSGSSLEAWISPKATTEHTADEHWVESLKAFAGNIVAGTGFTIYGATTDNTRLYGRYNIAWRWS